MPRSFRLAARLSGVLPAGLRIRLYALGARREAVPPGRLRGDQAAAAAAWFTRQYRMDGRVPAVFIGASNGAIADLAAVMGAPWLPQTFLVLVRDPTPAVDDLDQVIARARRLGDPVLRHFPGVIAHQMHDAGNDRPNVRHAAYFRMKWHRLPEAYRQFLIRHLVPGGTIFVVDCRYRWPVRRLAPDHLFQAGGHGGLDPSAILAGHGVQETAEWQPEPEAEWGYDDRLTDDLRELARDRGFRILRISFDGPQDLSAPVARLLRRYRRGSEGSRLLVTNFNLLAPAHVLRTGAVSYWTVFNDRRSLDGLRRFLGEDGPFDRIDGLLFQNGVVAPGQADAAEWLEVLRQGCTGRARLLGLDAHDHPAGFAVFERFGRQLRQMEAGCPPDALPRLDPATAVGALAVEGVTIGMP